MPKGRRRGKSGLHRAGCRITSGGGDSKDSATEIYRLLLQVRVEGQCKRLPPVLVTDRAHVNPIRSKTETEALWRPVMLQVGRLSVLATAELDR